MFSLKHVFAIYLIEGQYSKFNLFIYQFKKETKEKENKVAKQEMGHSQGRHCMYVYIY